MSNDLTARPAATTQPAAPLLSQDGCPTEIIPIAAPAAAPVPARRSILRAATAPAAQPERGPFANWRGQAQTEELPAAPSPAFPDVQVPGPTRTERLAVRRERDRVAARRARRSYHIRAALVGIALAAVLLGALQLLALDGIASARQAALEHASQHDAAAATTAPAPAEQSEQSSPSEQADAPAEQWAVEGTTTAAPSPLNLPRCTTSPDTPLPCLATISPSQTRAVVLEEDASLTALVRR